MKYNLLALLLFANIVSAQIPPAAPERTLVLTHIAVIDATGSPVKPDMSVIIRNDRIVMIGGTAKLSMPDDAEIVDGTEMHEAGVQFMAGTDSANTFTLPGFALHEELELLVEAGFTPMEAIQAATLNPAKYLGREKELGTIESGKLADLVLLDANPLVDIRNSQKIRAVVVNGRYLSRADLDSMLSRAEAAAK
jgi:imidazolonepropionase-like amidohydrolase